MYRPLALSALLIALVGCASPTTTPSALPVESTAAVTTPAATIPAPEVPSAPIPVRITTAVAPLPAMELCGSLGGCLHRVALLRTDTDPFLERRGLPRLVGVANVEYTDVMTPLADFAELTPGLYVLIGIRQQVSDIVGGPDGPLLGSGSSCSMTFAVAAELPVAMHVDFTRSGCNISAGE